LAKIENVADLREAKKALAEYRKTPASAVSFDAFLKKISFKP